MQDHAPYLKAKLKRRKMMTGRIKVAGGVAIFFIAIIVSLVIVLTPANAVLRAILLLIFDGLAGWYIINLFTS